MALRKVKCRNCGKWFQAQVVPIKSSMFSTRTYQIPFPLCEDCDEENEGLSETIYEDLIAGAQVAEEDRRAG